jgi:hypothetical protein
MSRLFITGRELDLISDLTKEVNKDVIGTKIYYYSISATKTRIHDVYAEAPEKIFENPVEVTAVVEYSETDQSTTKFGIDKNYTVKVFLHARDLLDVGLSVQVGDFFSYGEVFYEIAARVVEKTLFGQIEHYSGVTLTAVPARKNQFTTKILGPTDFTASDPDAVQTTYNQMRGFKENDDGLTGDVRALREKGILSDPVTGPKQVSPRGSDVPDDYAFYDEGEG